MTSSLPILTLNTEMHTAVIQHISVDRRGRTLLTASKDKTAKLWDIDTGTLLRTLRPPIGEGDEGMLFAGALSPDGRIAAVGGWTSKDGLNNSIYVFDAHSGIMVHCITGLPSVINDLSFSPDGRYLAAILGGGHGIRCWRTSDYTLEAEDNNYKQRAFGLAFDTGGRLATTCYDGHVRLYDAQFKLLKKVKTTGGKEPYALSFSPDGRLLALGYMDSPTIQILDAQTLAVEYEPDISGATEVRQRLNKIVFSADNSHLAAGGFHQLYKNKQWNNQVRVWKQAGKGAFVDIPSGSTILDIKALPNGNFVFAGALPDWGVVDPVAKQRTQYRGPELLDYRSTDKSHFRLGAEGLEVGITPFAGSPLRFRLPGRVWEALASKQPGPVTEQNGLVLTDWNNHIAPKLNGQSLHFLKQQHEFNQCADIADSQQGIVFGTSYSLYHTDSQGQLRWRTPTQLTVWHTKVDSYSLVAAAALGDGTIRWYRLSDGELLLSLYLHPDNRRWVLWTPGGYYDCAPGAEELLGWHVNQGPEHAAEYYPLSKFRERYYNPDVIDLVLETLDETAAVQRAARENGRTAPVTARTVLHDLPPVVRVLSPTDGASIGSHDVTLDYTVQSTADAPVTAVRFIIDGRPVTSAQGFQPGGARQSATISIPAADCSVSVIAESSHGASAPATVRLRWAGSGPATTPGSDPDLRPMLYVLAIGVGEYTNPELSRLQFAAKDARDFAAVLQPQKGRLYRDVQLRLLTEAEANKDAILDGLDWLQHQVTARDVAILYFAGHGTDDNAGNFFFLPIGADPDSLRRTAISHAEVQTTVASVPGKIIVFMDACHSGGMMKAVNPNRRGGPNLTRVINELIAAENGGIVFSASTSRQYALESGEWGNGAFTKALVEGLSGQAQTTEGGRITWKSLDLYISERVKALTEGQQSPVAVGSTDVPDFPVSVVV